MKRSHLSVFTIALLPLLLGGCQTLSGAQFANIDGGAIEYATQGSASPVVVFEAGLGDDMTVWRSVFPEVTGFARTFAYNRAGYGGSTRRAEARTGAQIVSELRETLRAAGLPPPYVLVGHSLGGAYLELFARTYPAEVAGLVLVESRAASMTRRCREAKLLMCDPPRFLVNIMPGAAAAEYAASDETFATIENAGPMPRVPLIVLTSTRLRIAEGPNWSQLWLTTQKELSKSSPLGIQRTTPWAGHYIQREQPQLVIDAIREVVRDALVTAAVSP
jgi:pimeloyl-ACP methyl ester carboxylesterase